LADLYSDDPQAVPEWVWDEIHRILAILYEREGIEYTDITSYNFMQEAVTDNIYIIDFGHAYYTGDGPVHKVPEVAAAPAAEAGAGAGAGAEAPGSTTTQPAGIRNWFLREVLQNAEKSWNPDFC